MDWHWVLILLEVAWVASLATWIVLEKRSPTSTLAWIFGLAFLPLLGALVYLLVGPRRLERKRTLYNEALAGLWEADLVNPPVAEIPHDVLRQVRLVAGAGDAPLLPATGMELLPDGMQTFREVGNAIDAARHHAHLEFYIWEPDALGVDLRDRLAARARAGVEVRVLVDAVGSPQVGRRFFTPLTAAGGLVAYFNPPRFTFAGARLLNFRTHRKIVVIDGRVGFTGGRNVSGPHSSGSAGAPPWRDTHLRLEGPAVGGLQAVFLENWHYATRHTPSGEAYFPRLGGQPVAWMQVVASGPDSDVYPIHELLVSAISAADERAWLVSPYVVPDDSLLMALQTAGHRGVDVRMIVPRRGDNRFVQAAMRSFFDELTAAGVRIYEYLPGMHHGKTLVIDRELAMVGTANLDNRSFRLNFEVAVAIQGTAGADLLAADFERDLVECEPLAPGRDARIGFPTRLAESTARLFAPIL